METAKAHPKPTDDRFIGMEVKGVFYSEKAEAGKAILEACKAMTSPEAIPLGRYRGFETELLFDTTERSYVVRLKDRTSRSVPLGDDIHGNITRLDNGIDRFSEALKAAHTELEETEKQFETAKQEVLKPFAKEDELKSKLARLDELKILLNMDKTENEIVGGGDTGNDCVGTAIRQGCEAYTAEAFGVELTRRGTVADNKYATNVPKVFACGDMRRGQSLVVWALREGRDTAAVVDETLMGYTNL